MQQHAAVFLIFPLVGAAVLPTLYIFIWAQYKKPYMQWMVSFP